MNFLTPFITKIWTVKDYSIIYQYENPFGAGNGIDISKDTSLIAIGNAYILTLLNSHWTPSKVVEQPVQPKMLYPNPSGNEITIPLEAFNDYAIYQYHKFHGIIEKQII